MEMFFSEAALRKAKAGARRSTWVFRGLAAGSLALLVILCLMTRTSNAGTMRIAIPGSMAALGWACILLYCLWVRPARARARHLETLLDGERETAEGIFRMSGRPVRVPNSVTVRAATVETGDGEARRFHLDEELAGRMPAPGSRVRVQTASRYITGMEVLEAGGEAPAVKRTAVSRLRGVLRRAGALVPALVLWAMASIVIGGFIFERITDTAPRNKIVIYADCGTEREAELANLLERRLGEPIRMVQVHSFEYVLFGSADIDQADLYIMPAARAEKYREWLAPLPEDVLSEGELFMMGGEAYGIPVWDTAAGIRTASDYFRYETGETYYLFFGKTSLHVAGHEGAADNRAEEAARLLQEMR